MPIYAFLRPFDHVTVFTQNFPNDGQAAAHAGALSLDWERLNGAETKPDDLLLVVPGDAVIEAPPVALPTQVVAVQNRGEVTNLRQRRQNGQSITYPVRVDLRDGRTLVIATEAELDAILAASTNT